MNVRIGAFDYKMEETLEPILSNHAECAGQIDYEQLTIKIKKDMPIQRIHQTILHELFHGIIREYDIDIGDLDEEELVEQLGTSILQILKDNKELINYIREEK